jgi:hypothetical protein
MKRVIGPFNLSINGDIGILLDGFEHPPVFLTGHGRPYYDARVQALGYHKVKDVVAYSLDTTATPPRTMVEAARRAREAAAYASARRQVALRPRLRSARSSATRGAQLEPCRSRRRSLRSRGNALYLVPRDFVQFAEVDGETAAMLVIVPNLNELIGDLAKPPSRQWAARGGARAAAFGATRLASDKVPDELARRALVR